MFFALLPIALSLVPELAKWIGGPTGGAISETIHAIVKAATGTDDATDAARALASDPAAVAKLRVDLAQIVAQQEASARQAQLDEFRAALADTANARAQTVALAASGSKLQWGAGIVSALVLVLFGACLAAFLFHGVPEESATLLNILLGTLAAMASNVVGYWVGSSAGSARKTDILAEKG